MPAATRLDEATCWSLLRTVAVSRLAVVIDAKPEIFPINHVADHGSLVFRTADGTKLTAALGEGTVAFEADGSQAKAPPRSVMPAAARRGRGTGFA